MIDAPRRARGDRWIALLLALVATAALFRAGRTEGFTRDELYYVHAAEDRYGWFTEIATDVAAGKPLRAFSKASIDRWFSYNHEHPELMKMLFAASWGAFHKCDCPHQPGRHPINYTRRHKTLGWMSEAEAFRFPACVFGGLLVGLTYLFGARLWSRRAGLVAGALSLLMPHLFFHAELACFDAPVATTWLLCVYCYYRSLTERRYELLTGVAFGLALATKHNGFFLPFVLGAHWLWQSRKDIFARQAPPIPRAFLWMAVAGPVVEIALWPWMWFDTVARVREYFGFHLHHVYYNMEYLGRNYSKPPFPKSYAFVMTLFTVPATTLALALVGALTIAAAPLVARYRAAHPATAVRKPGEPPPPPVWIWRAAPVGVVVRGAGLSRADRDHCPGALIALNAVFPMCVIAFTGAPIFGGTKHWLAALPFIALLAGLGADAVSRLIAEILLPERWQGPRGRVLAMALVVVGAISPSLVETWRSHPYGLTHYNLLAGGPAGGADLGLNRQFWGYATRGVLPWINQHAPTAAPIYWHDAHQEMLNLDVREGLLRPDIGNTVLEEPGVRQSQLALVIHEKHFNKYEYWIWDFYGTARPSMVLTLEGVPLVTLYERPPIKR